MKKCKKPSAIAAKIPGMADGGPTAGMLGWGMARNAAQHLAGRGQQIARAESDALGGAPAAPAAPAARPVTAGGLSGRRDGAVPPAHMLIAQRRGMADGGAPPPGYKRFYETNGMASDRLAETAQRNFDAARGSVPASNNVDTMGRPVSQKRTMYGYRGYDASREPMLDAVADKRQSAGLPSAQAIRTDVAAKIAQGMPAQRPAAPVANPGNVRMAQMQGMFGMADGGIERGNAEEIEAGGGMVRGPGGPTDDQVGPVALSPKEYVLPADTVEAMGGAPALDKIRAATHKFVDPKNKPSIARGMANGGLPGYAVGEIPVEEISMGRSRAERAAIDEAVKKGQRPPGAPKNQARTPALDRVSSRIQARNAPKAPSSKKAGIAKGVGALGLATGAYDSLRDIDNGYRDYSQEALGVETPTGSVAADAFRTMDNVGNALTMGVAGRVGRGIESMTNGNGFMDGFKSPSDRDQFTAQGAQAAGLPEAATEADAAAQPQAAQTAGPGVPSTKTIGKINVSRQPNGVMSFSGNGPVQGYDGPAAGQLKGGGFMTMPAAAMRSASPAASAELQAARAAAAARGDYQGAIDSISAEQNGFKQAPRSNAISMRLPQTFGDMMQYRAQMAMSRLNQRANESDSREQTDRMRIASGMPYEQERTRGSKLANDQSELLSGMVNTYLNAPDEATRTSALAKLNALNGKSGGADKYITVDMESGVDVLGNPIMRKVPFNTRTGQIVDVSGGGQAAQPGKVQGKEGERARDPKTGLSYVFTEGDWQLVK